MKRMLGLAAAAAAFSARGRAPPAAAAHHNGAPPRDGPPLTHTDGCAGAGAFGYFGPGNNMAGGADGTQTGYNNSNLCGNPQN